jgi:hypothetical protein
MKQENNMDYKKLFISADLDYCHHAAVIIDLETYQFYNALFSCQQTGGAIGDFFLLKTGGSISCEQVKAFAEKSEDNRAKKYLKITNDNWKELIDEK